MAGRKKLDPVEVGRVSEIGPMPVEAMIQRSLQPVVWSSDENKYVKRDKADVATSGTTHSNALSYEDEFTAFYTDPTLLGSGVSIMMPPFNMQQLEELAQNNNALMPCIDSMIANIDGTGHIIKPIDNTDPNKRQETSIGSLNDFFNEVYPGMSFIGLRKLIRRDLETVGNAFIEVLRTMDGKIAFMRHIEAKTMRIVRLDNAVLVAKEVMRNGKLVKININVRERRFVQRVNLKLQYFKEYQASREVSKTTGAWETAQSPVAVTDRGTEVVHFIKMKDPGTPYGVPLWVPQIPSVLGSRKAEEYNLNFFDSGGIPPVLFIVSGGVMAEKAKEYLNRLMSSSGSLRSRGAVLEAYATDGSLEQANNVKVTVERFGHERQSDSLFENYDKRSANRVRMAWRLPSLLIGDVTQYTYAAAYASYSVAEAQIFSLERKDFDEFVNTRLLPELDPKREFVFKSNPLMVKDSPLQMEAMTLAAAAAVIDGDELVTNLNRIAGTEMHYSDNSTLPVGPITSRVIPGQSADGSSTVDQGHSGRGSTPHVAPRGSKKSVELEEEPT